MDSPRPDTNRVSSAGVWKTVITITINKRPLTLEEHASNRRRTSNGQNLEYVVVDITGVSEAVSGCVAHSPRRGHEHRMPSVTLLIWEIYGKYRVHRYVYFLDHHKCTVSREGSCRRCECAMRPVAFFYLNGVPRPIAWVACMLAPPVAEEDPAG